jgi:signal transduction histidine kinase/ActR/RegA family two-component response regulator
MNPYSFIPFSSFLINTVLASVVLALNPHSKTNRAYAIFAINFALWGFLNFIEWNLASPDLLRICTHLEPLCWLPLSILVINFIYELINRKRDKAFWLFALVVVAWSVFAVTTGSLIKEFHPAYWGEYHVVSKWYLPAVVMTSLLPAFYAFYLLFKAAKLAKDTHFRTQIRYLTIGTLIMFVLVFTESVFRTSLLQMRSIPFLGSFFLIIQSGFVFFAIVRHRFLSVDVRDAAHEIFSQTHVGVLIFDLNLNIKDMNAAACDFFGTIAIKTADDLNVVLGKEYRFEENCKNREITLTQNDKVKIGLLSQSELFDRGNPIGKLIIIHDITHQREEEHERALLESKVQQSHASRLEALGMLAGGIAHDFNNMLAGVYGYADLLRLSLAGKNEKLASYTENIMKTVQRAADLTKKLLTFARRNVSEMTVFDLHDTITDTVSLLQHTIDKRITVETGLLAQNHMLKGDRAQIQNLLLNMAINAGDAMPNGGTLAFTTRNTIVASSDALVQNKDASGGEYLVVDIQDTGTGMTDEVKKKVFNPFFTTKQPGKGTGLGLASAYGIAMSHGGFISIDTELGKGTTFHTHFPLYTSSDGSMKCKEAPKIEYGNGKILLVDDEEDVRNSITQMLMALGYTVTTCKNGEEAVSWYTETNDMPDIVLLDVMMPKLTGDQCAAALLKINPKAIILFISGYPGTLSAETLKELSTKNSGLELLPKPFTIEQLSGMVKQAMDKKRKL